VERFRIGHVVFLYGAMCGDPLVHKLHLRASERTDHTEYISIKLHRWFLVRSLVDRVPFGFPCGFLRSPVVKVNHLRKFHRLYSMKGVLPFSVLAKTIQF
jgi:hypothetical protein